MNIAGDFIQGLVQVIKVTGAPLLYRYPYRTSSEGLRGDWMSIGKDIDSVMGKFKDLQSDGQDDE